MSPDALIFPISHFLKDLSHSALVGAGICDVKDF